MTRSRSPWLVALLASVVLSGCSAFDRLKYAGGVPPLSDLENPTERPGYRVTTMPMPDPVVSRRQANSLWRPGSRTFFEDLRATSVGDIVTVQIDISDKADFSNTTTQNRSNAESSALPQFFGLQNLITSVLPGADPASLVSLSSSKSNSGAGTISRSEQISLKVAAVVTQVLPNGNMVIHGRQETRVNAEVRELQVAGVVRPQDIDIQNQVTYEKIAEARVSYGGRGNLSDIQQPRYGTNLIDIFLPF